MGYFSLPRELRFVLQYLNDAELRVLLAVHDEAAFSDDKSTAELGRAELMSFTGKSESAVERAKSVLENCGLIDVRRPRIDGLYQRSIIKLKLPPKGPSTLTDVGSLGNPPRDETRDCVEKVGSQAHPADSVGNLPLGSPGNPPPGFPRRGPTLYKKSVRNNNEKSVPSSSPVDTTAREETTATQTMRANAIQDSNPEPPPSGLDGSDLASAEPLNPEVLAAGGPDRVGWWTAADVEEARTFLGAVQANHRRYEGEFLGPRPSVAQCLEVFSICTGIEEWDVLRNDIEDHAQRRRTPIGSPAWFVTFAKNQIADIRERLPRLKEAAARAADESAKRGAEEAAMQEELLRTARRRRDEEARRACTSCRGQGCVEEPEGCAWCTCIAGRETRELRGDGWLEELTAARKRALRYEVQQSAWRALWDRASAAGRLGDLRPIDNSMAAADFESEQGLLERDRLLADARAILDAPPASVTERDVAAVKRRAERRAPAV